MKMAWGTDVRMKVENKSHQPPENKEVSLAKVNTKVVFNLEMSSRGSLSKGKGNQLVSLVLRLLIEKIVNVRELRGIYAPYNCIP